MKRIYFDTDKKSIAIKFDYSPGLVNRVKQLPDRVYDPEQRIWFIPATADHARLAADFATNHQFEIDSTVLKLSRSEQKFKNTSIRSKLYQYQIDALDFLNRSGGRAILADDMGLGKTVIALAWMWEQQFKRVLVVCPSAVVYNWKNEAERWLNWSAQVLPNSAVKFNNTRLTIVSYTMLVNRLEELNQISWDLVVVDECHYISNPKTLRTRAVKSLDSTKYLGLSGTPFLNRPIEMFNNLHIIAPMKFRNYFQFGIRYCGGYRDQWGWHFDGISNVAQLRELIRPYFLRRTKQEVLDQLPPITRSYIDVQISNMDEYRKFVYEAKENKVNSLHIINHLRYIVGMGKVNAAIEIAEMVLTSKRQVVIFAHHKDVVEKLFEHFKPMGVCRIVGDVPAEERQSAIDSFRAGLHRVCIISTAGGEGINLQSADTMIFVERVWNPGKESQIESRIHRLGQRSNVQIIYLHAINTIDQHIHNLIEKKREMTGELIGLDDIPVKDVLNLALGDKNDSSNS